MGHVLCAGERGSPGGPVAIATLMLIVADDMQLRGVTCGAGELDATVVSGPTATVEPPTKKAPKKNARIVKRKKGRETSAPSNVMNTKRKCKLLVISLESSVINLSSTCHHFVVSLQL